MLYSSAWVTSGCALHEDRPLRTSRHTVEGRRGSLSDCETDGWELRRETDPMLIGGDSELESSTLRRIPLPRARKIRCHRSVLRAVWDRPQPWASWTGCGSPATSKPGRDLPCLFVL